MRETRMPSTTANSAPGRRGDTRRKPLTSNNVATASKMALRFHEPGDVSVCHTARHTLKPRASTPKAAANCEATISTAAPEVNPRKTGKLMK